MTSKKHSYQLRSLLNGISTVFRFIYKLFLIPKGVPDTTPHPHIYNWHHSSCWLYRRVPQTADISVLCSLVIFPGGPSRKWSPETDPLINHPSPPIVPSALLHSLPLPRAGEEKSRFIIYPYPFHCIGDF